MESESASLQRGLLHDSHLYLSFLFGKEITKAHSDRLPILGETSILHLLVIYFLFHLD